MKPLDKINKTSTIWAAIAAAAATVWAVPGVQAAVVNAIVHPTPQTIGGTIGTIVTGLLLLYAKPPGVS